MTAAVRQRAVRWPVLLLVALLAMLAGCSVATAPSEAEESVDPVSGFAWVAVEELPPEAAETLELIDAGGPFPYDKDGSTFGNREGLLPDEPRGFYREYTVDTPGSDDRGARRIVTGGDEIFYWTDDHYESFRRIRR